MITCSIGRPIEFSFDDVLHAGRKVQQLVCVAVDERQIVDLAIVDGAAQHRVP